MVDNELSWAHVIVKLEIGGSPGPNYKASLLHPAKNGAALALPDPALF